MRNTKRDLQAHLRTDPPILSNNFYDRRHTRSSLAVIAWGRFDTARAAVRAFIFEAQEELRKIRYAGAFAHHRQTAAECYGLEFSSPTNETRSARAVHAPVRAIKSP
jgi:hypothetical protein